VLADITPVVILALSSIGVDIKSRNPRNDKSGNEFCGMNGFETVGMQLTEGLAI